MPYSESLADRVRLAIRGRRGIVEKRMFGAIVFLHCGNMLVGVWHATLIVRLGPDQAAMFANEANVRPFDVTGKPMKGWLMVEPDGLENDRQLATWVDRAWLFVETLPPK